MKLAVFFIAGWIAMGAIIAVATIGKPRKPITPGVAAGIIVIDAAITVALVLAAMRLS